MPRSSEAGSENREGFDSSKSVGIIRFDRFEETSKRDDVDRWFEDRKGKIESKDPRVSLAPPLSRLLSAESGGSRANGEPRAGMIRLHSSNEICNLISFVVAARPAYFLPSLRVRVLVHTREPAADGLPNSN